MKNKLNFLFLTMTIICGMVFFVFADELDEPPVDIYVLLDTSDYMNVIDPSRSAIIAVSEFTEEVGVGSRMGIVGFSGRTNPIPFTYLENEYAIIETRMALSVFQYLGDESNIGVALLTASNTMSRAENLQNPLVILISTRPPAVSDYETEDALFTLEENNIELYAIYLTTENINELPQTLTEILRNHRHGPEAEEPDETDETDEDTLEMEEEPETDEEQTDEETEKTVWVSLVFMAFISAAAAVVSVFLYIRAVI